ncbi:hypothetical protein E2R23_05145 [Burkholderia pseudomallei]|nr:hypothetical protein EXY28_05130 [Burkholderia pseudomallei]QBI46005.1 hypothetical protein EXY72_05160 [Burkholderia pseudomallei]QBL77290.1 hypothetical protein EYA82_05185 [Burkholderia pseudomallei]QBL83958.1 hypothetical protein EYA88_05145 [Burkholderia pseudomallei]QBP54411.1 hypothetical protein E2R23_05145 [Burkholderia pseudomallei]
MHTHPPMRAHRNTCSPCDDGLDRAHMPRRSTMRCTRATRRVFARSTHVARRSKCITPKCITHFTCVNRVAYRASHRAHARDARRRWCARAALPLRARRDRASRAPRTRIAGAAALRANAPRPAPRKRHRPTPTAAPRGSIDTPSDRHAVLRYEQFAGPRRTTLSEHSPIRLRAQLSGSRKHRGIRLKHRARLERLHPTFAARRTMEPTT